MPYPNPLPEPLRGVAFSAASARRLGVDANRLRRADLVPVFHGVRIPRRLWAEADDDERFLLRCAAYRAKLPRGCFFSHATAARILGIPLPARLETAELHVASASADLRPRGRGVRGHRSPGAETSSFYGFRVRVPAEVWCELASVLTVDELIAAGDRILSDRPVMLSTRRHLDVALTKHAAGRGARALREALPQLRERVWSPKETWTRLVLLRAGLPEPERNHPIRGADGRLVAIGDLVYPQLKIVVEYEGERWHRDGRAVLDVDRFNALALLGWTIIRIRRHHTAHDVERMARAALRSRGWRG